MKKIECWIDGACEPKNPGGTASWGVYMVEEGIPLENWGIVGTGEGISNNVAEYSALIEAFNIAKSPRERNTFADALSKRALAEKGIKPHYSRR